MKRQILTDKDNEVIGIRYILDDPEHDGELLFDELTRLLGGD